MRRLLVVLVLTLGVVASGCGLQPDRVEQSVGDSDPQEAETAQLARELLAGSTYLGWQGDPLPDPGTLQGVEAAVVFRVTEISEPFFNSPDGRFWEGAYMDIYSRVTGTVEEVWHGDWPLGEETLLVRGDAAQRWESADEIPPPAAVSGGFVQGERFIILVRKHSFPFQDGDQLWPTTSFSGNWRLRGNQAIGSHTSHSARIPELRERMAKGFEARDRALENRPVDPPGRGPGSPPDDVPGGPPN